MIFTLHIINILTEVCVQLQKDVMIAKGIFTIMQNASIYIGVEGSEKGG